MSDATPPSTWPEILDAIHDNVATKSEVAAVGPELDAVRSELKADFTAVRAEIALVEHQLMTRVGGAIAVAVGIILAAISYVPHG